MLLKITEDFYVITNDSSFVKGLTIRERPKQFDKRTKVEHDSTVIEEEYEIKFDEPYEMIMITSSGNFYFNFKSRKGCRSLARKIDAAFSEYILIKESITGGIMPAVKSKKDKS